MAVMKITVVTGKYSITMCFETNEAKENGIQRKIKKLQLNHWEHKDFPT